MRGRNGAIQWHSSPGAAADMERLCVGRLWTEVRDEMRRLWGVELTKCQIKGFMSSRGIRSGVVGGRFEKGQVPPNKGRKWDEYMSPEAQERCRATCFRPGNRTGAALDRWAPVGAEHVRSDGTVYVKVNDGPRENGHFMHRWRQRSRINYEAAYGPIPDGCYVFHADGDPANDNPENLVAVPLRLRGTISKLGNPYADRETLETAMLMAEVVQAAHRAEKGVSA